MKNNKGFTLVELIVVIALVAVLSISISVGIQNNLKKQKVEEEQKLFDQIITAAKIYDNLKDKKTCAEDLKIQNLICIGLLDENVIGKKINNTEINGDQEINNDFSAIGTIERPDE